MHFFADPPPPQLSDPTVPAELGDLQYLGYAVFRPLPAAPVGRTMLKVPDSLVNEVTVAAWDHVNVLGVPLKVWAAPFMAQDGQLSRCAHTTTWVIAYQHHLAFGTPRVLPADISETVEAAGDGGRSRPSAGLTVSQIAETCRAAGLPPLVYLLDQLPPGETLPRVVCRYLNSGMPVTITGRSHAFVLIGYGRTRTATGEEMLHFLRQDDEVGPYDRIPHWALDKYGPWEAAIVPLPAKVYLPAEEAESVGKRKLQETLQASDNEPAQAQCHRQPALDRPGLGTSSIRPKAAASAASVAPPMAMAPSAGSACNRLISSARPPVAREA